MKYKLICLFAPNIYYVKLFFDGPILIQLIPCCLRPTTLCVPVRCELCTPCNCIWKGRCFVLDGSVSFVVLLGGHIKLAQSNCGGFVGDWGSIGLL